MLTSQHTLSCKPHAALHPGGCPRRSSFPSIVHMPARKAPGRAQGRRCRGVRARAPLPCPNPVTARDAAGARPEQADEERVVGGAAPGHVRARLAGGRLALAALARGRPGARAGRRRRRLADERCAHCWLCGAQQRRRVGYEWHEGRASWTWH